MEGFVGENFMEVYQQRMAEIQDVSDVIAVANLQLGKLLQRFGWSRQAINEKPGLVKCPLDPGHSVKESNVEEHVKICCHRKQGMKSVEKKDIPVSTSYSYENTNIVSVHLERDTYERLGISLPESTATSTDDMEIETQTNDQAYSGESMVETREEIVRYEPRDSLDELRFIYSWTTIPPNYCQVNMRFIAEDEMKAWLNHNLPDASHTGIENKNSIVTFAMKHMSEMQHPDEFLRNMYPVLKTRAPEFVLKLWQFVCGKQLCQKSQIPEHTRNEFAFYSHKMVSPNEGQTTTNKQSGVERKKIKLDELSLLSNEWSIFNMTREQRLRVYEEVRKIAKVTGEGEDTKFEDLKAQAEQQMKVITEFELKDKGEKTQLEVMAELRDYKRRRMSYRGKNKESRKMSAIEVLRELVEQQMLYLKILYQQQQQQAQIESLKEESKPSNNIKKSVGKHDEHALDNTERQECEDRRTSRREHDRDRSRQREHRRSRSRENRRRSRSNSRERRRRSQSRERRRNSYHQRDKQNKIERTKPKQISNVTYY